MRATTRGNWLKKSMSNVVVAPAEGALQYTVPKDEFLQNTLTVKRGMKIRQEQLVEALYGAGYDRRPLVEGPGQFSVRGGIVDLFPPDMAKPARLEFFGDEIDTMTCFDLMTQRREGKIEKVYLSPAREVLLSDIASAKDVILQELKGRKGPKKDQFLAVCGHDLKLLEEGTLPRGINHLRVGEALLLGTDSTGMRTIPYLNQETMEIRAQVVELRRKPSVPRGTVGVDAFGAVPSFEDRGNRRRAILALGKQDVRLEGLTPLEPGVEILGGSSDHLVCDVEEVPALQLGDVLTFRPNYGAMLAAATSPYLDLRVL